MSIRSKLRNLETIQIRHWIVLMIITAMPLCALAQSENPAEGPASGGIFSTGIADVQAAAARLSAAATSATAASSDGLDCDKIDFEGFANREQIGVVSGSIEFTFGSSWIAGIDLDAGGDANVANEPSQSTIASFLDQNDIGIDISDGVQIVRFRYSAAADSLPVHVIAYDENGNLVDDNRGDFVGRSLDGAACAGDPQGWYCAWGTLTLASASSNIRRIEIIGTVSNHFGIDDIEFCTGRCAPVPGEAAQIEEITDFGECAISGSGNRPAKWGQFGERAILEADSGETLEIECDRAFFMKYGSIGGPQGDVGVCPFGSGKNKAWFVHAGDGNNNGKPDCFIRTRWLSKDYGMNDKRPNPWTGDWDDPLESLFPPIFDLLDWAETTYDVNTDSLTKIGKKYRYRVGPPVTGAEIPGPEGDLFVEVPVRTTVIDPPLGPETQPFFDMIRENAAMNSDPTPMSYDTSPSCDFDRNGRCDAVDRSRLAEFIGLCDGEIGFHPGADIDADGCLTVEDDRALFSVPDATLPECRNGIDDDADGLADFSDPGFSPDPGCFDENDTSETITLDDLSAFLNKLVSDGEIASSIAKKHLKTIEKIDKRLLQGKTVNAVKSLAKFRSTLGKTKTRTSLGFANADRLSEMAVEILAGL